MNDEPLRDETLLSLQEGFFMEIIELDLLLAFDLQYLTPSSISVSSASNSFFGRPQGMSGFTFGGEFYRGGRVF